MGRTVPTYRNWLDAEVQRLQNFRRALRNDDREAFDEIVEMAREHASAASYLAAEYPFEAMVLSVLVEMRKKMKSGE
jgi:hypothetical protein